MEKIDQSKLMDTEWKTLVVPEKAEPVTTMLFGPEFMAKALYQLCSPEDLALGKSLVRVASLFLEDLSKMPAFTEERYGSVPKVYIVCGRDEAISVEYQRWMIQRTPVKEVMEIEGADHMAMLSSPVELFRCLARIVHKYGRTMPCTI
ncbi:hypothetical protein HPP92_016170 [Vanilla planifolia]|uniref:AB hydrolase-1 domain-containing protein n=1 Tax=Vanilla planifolia TaxID=51239 RepID=A0A835QFU2_VANPL|nr:hypothetical protein HPP92_016771 [Vanilla planifolia]KAG0471624.1 hypothetical protein HPP92_016170 [Vanilla planifolia]